MLKCVCDRCEKIIEKPDYRWRVKTAFHFVHFDLFDFFDRAGIKDETYETYDLCAECAETLWNWLKNTPKEGRK